VLDGAGKKETGDREARQKIGGIVLRAKNRPLKLGGFDNENPARQEESDSRAGVVGGRAGVRRNRRKEMTSTKENGGLERPASPDRACGSGTKQRVQR